MENVDNFFSGPLDFLKNSYGWGQSNFDGARMLLGLEGLLGAWGLNVREDVSDAGTLAQLQAALSPADAYALSLRLVFFEANLHPNDFAAGSALYILPETASDKPGFAVLPYAKQGFGGSIDLTSAISLDFKGGIDLSGGVGALVRPNRDTSFLTGLKSGTPSALTGNLTITFRLNQPAAPILIVGIRDRSHLEFGGISTTAGTRAGIGGKLDVFTEFALQAGKIVIKPSPTDLDGLLTKLLPSQGFVVGFDLTTGFSTARGLYIGNGSGFEITLASHIDAGPIKVLSAVLAVRFRDGGVPIDLAATVRGDLGPVGVTVEKVGFTGNFTFPADRKGNLGPVDLSLGFKPPTGLGVRIDAGAVSGGGFLSFDNSTGRYAGAVELSVYSVAVKAFGLVDTVLPDSSQGYSFVVIISAEFTPIQLGFGFTLVGVGGLVGINRTIDSKNLESGIQAGSITNLLFPRNPVLDAPSIINDLGRFFPAANDRALGCHRGSGLL